MTNRELLDQSLAELRAQLERHQQCVQSVMAADHSDASADCPWNFCRHRQILCSLLLEAAQVLDATRKSFKSKPLEQLRQRFLQTLTEEVNRGI